MDRYTVSIEKEVKPQEVLFVREEPVSGSVLKLWQECINQALCIAGARDEQGTLVGVGFLVGNFRHGEIVDLSVHSLHRRNGIAAKIMDTLTGFAAEKEIVYLGLTYDSRFPWLKDFYENYGFKSIDFAMWHVASLEAVGDAPESGES